MKRTYRKLLSFLLVLSMFIGMAGIISIESSYAASSKTHLKKTAVSLKAGKTYKQRLIDKNGNVIKATKVKWKSSKKSVARINKNGKITAVKAGKAKMTAKYKGKTYRFTVRVKKSSGSSSGSSSDGKVYWTPSGSVYHKSKDCPTLARSRTIKSGTKAQSGKSRCCKVCG